MFGLLFFFDGFTYDGSHTSKFVDSENAALRFHSIFEAPILDTSVMTPYLLEILRKTYAQITLHHVLKELEISN